MSVCTNKKSGAFLLPGKDYYMGLYSQIKEQITARDIAEHYGYEVNRSGMMCCPFHDDKHPSMKVDKNFYCFGCGAKGNAIEFAAKLHELTTYEAALNLIDDFMLPIDVDKKIKREKKQYAEIKRIKREKLNRQLFEKSVDRIYSVYLRYFHLLNSWAVKYAPKSIDDEWHPLFIEAAQKKDYVEYLLDIIDHGSLDEKAELILEKGKEVLELERRINEFESHEDACSSGNSDIASA